MFKNAAILLMTLLALSACSSSPKVIHAASSADEIRLTVGMATLVEMPDQARVQSVTVGNPSLVAAQADTDVVNLSANNGAGETNLIIRARDEDSHVKVYQYRIVVQER